MVFAALSRLTTESAELNRLARESRFCRRTPRKLPPHLLVLSCVLQVLAPRVSLRRHAALVGMLEGLTLSKQALHKRLKASTEFLQGCITQLLARPLAKELGALRGGAFARILLQDSSCVSLRPGHATAFPGPRNQHGFTQSSLRLQLLYDLLSERFLHFHLTPFTRNDQAAALDVLPLLRPDDLLVRDLGYFTQESLAGIDQAGACFLTRWRFGSRLLDPHTGLPLVLRELLRPGTSLDRTVLLSNGLSVRLLAWPLDPAVAASRRRLARANRDGRLSHNSDYYYLLGWTLLLTNASPARLPLPRATAVYRLRWRIELIFKSWKSHLGLLHAARCGRAQFLPLVLALLIFALCLHSLFPPAPSASPPPSLLQLCALFSSYLLPVYLAAVSPAVCLQRLSDQLLYHGRYEKRPRLHYHHLKLLALRPYPPFDCSASSPLPPLSAPSPASPALC